MRYFLAVLAGAIAVASCAPSGTGATMGPQTVTGQIIDLGCYARNPTNTGMDHDRAFACALSCIKWEGQPVGLLTSGGVVYQLAGGVVADNNAKVVPYIAQTVTVSGDVSERDGLLVITADDLTGAAASQNNPAGNSTEPGGPHAG